MTFLNHSACTALGALLIVPTIVVGLPTANSTMSSLKAFAAKPLTCLGPGLAADAGAYMKANAVNFCQTFDTATLKEGDSIISKAYSADNGVFYNFQSKLTNFECETNYLDIEECYDRLFRVLDGCNSGEEGRNVGGIITTDCGQMVVLPGTEKRDAPNASPDEGLLAVRTITETGCNPPVWSACTALERSTMLKQACDYRLCLMAGNCDIC